MHLASGCRSTKVLRLCVCASQVKLEMDSTKAAELLAKYDKDQSGLMEFDEFVNLCIAMETINLDLAAPEMATKAEVVSH